MFAHLYLRVIFKRFAAIRLKPSKVGIEVTWMSLCVGDKGRSRTQCVGWRETVFPLRAVAPEAGVSPDGCLSSAVNWGSAHLPPVSRDLREVTVRRL